MSVEQKEAMAVMDVLAREIHGIYGQHAAEAGLKTPSWEDLPDKARAVSRDMAKLVVSKMQEAYDKGTKSKPPVEHASTVQIPLPKSWSAEEALRFGKGVKPVIEDLVNGLLPKLKDAKRISPIGKGLDDALSKITEEIAVEVVKENPEIRAKLRQIVEGELTRFISDDDEKEA